MAIGAIVGLVVLSLVVMAVWFARKKKRKSRHVDYAIPSPFASSQNSGDVSKYFSSLCWLILEYN